MQGLLDLLELDANQNVRIQVYTADCLSVGPCDVVFVLTGTACIW